MKAMTPEERFDRIERQMEFLASHQAQLSSSLESLREISVRHEAEIAAHGDQIMKLHDVVVSLGHVLEEQARRTDEQFRRTDERLNALILTVERHISDPRHGRN